MTDLANPYVHVTVLANGVAIVNIVNNPLSPADMRRLAADLVREADAIDRRPPKAVR